MLDKIFQAIDKKSQEEIEKVLKEKEAAILAMEKEHRQELKKRKEKEKALLQKQAEEEIEEFKQKKNLRVSFRLQEEKNKLRQQVYERALKKAAEIEEPKFEKLIKGLLRFVPPALLGKVAAGRKTAAVLRRITGNAAVEESLEGEGFIIQSQDLDIDLRLSQVLKQNREETDPQIIKILFAS